MIFSGHVEKQIARVRLHFLGFLTGMPDVELGINDMRRQGKEVVGRHDIIPVVTEEWIRLEAVEFHSCVQQDEYNKTHIIKYVTYYEYLLLRSCKNYTLNILHCGKMYHLDLHIYSINLYKIMCTKLEKKTQKSV